MCFAIPIDQHACIAKPYHILRRHLKLQRTNLSGTVECHHRCFPVSCKCKITVLLRDRLRKHINSGAVQQADNITHRLIAIPGMKHAPIRQFTIERVEVPVCLLRCPLHALLKGNGCCHDTTTLAQLWIQGKRVGKGVCGAVNRIRLSKITCVHSSDEMSIQ